MENKNVCKQDRYNGTPQNHIEKKNPGKMKLLLESRTCDLPQQVPKTSLKKRLSPLRYPGGKSKVIDQLYTCLDRHKLNRFVELFAGGASFGLSLLDGGVIQQLELNEIDPLVYNFWNAALNCSKDLIALLTESRPTVDGYFIARFQAVDFKIHNNECDIRMAYNYLLLNRTSFGGIISANPVCGKHGTSEQLCVRWNPADLAKRIRRIAEMSSRIVLHNEDAVKFLREKAGDYHEDTTIFIDPPYTKAGKQLYRETFKGRHEELADAVNTLFCRNSGLDIILTYDDCPLVRNLYPLAEVQQLRTSWSIYRTNDRDKAKEKMRMIPAYSGQSSYGPD